MAKVVMVWYGGLNYASPEEDDGEEFSSLSAARRAFAARADNPYYPCVEEDPPEDGGPEGHIYFGTLQDGCPANGPDRILSFGPRGGVRVD